MRVVIFSHAAGSPKYGPNLRWYYLGKRLIELGCDVTIIGSSYFHKYTTQPECGFINKETIDGIEYVFLRNVKYKGFLGRIANQFIFPAMAFVWSSLKSKSLKPDIVVCSSPPPFCVIAANRLAKKAHASLIYEVRDLWPMVVQELSGASSRHPYIRLLKKTEGYAIDNANLVVSVKPGDYDYFKSEYGLSKAKFRYLANGFLPQTENSSLPQVSDTKEVVIGYVGAMSAYYGLHELLEAAQLLNNEQHIKFVLVGGGEDYKLLLNLKKQNSLDSVEFIGRVSKAEVPRYMKKFDICYVGLKDVKANYHGISCNKLFEYMHAAKPVIASYRTKFDPVQEAQCGVTVDPGSPEQIAAAIRTLSKDPVKRQKLGVNARKYFDEHHHFSVIGEKYLETMKALVKS